MNLAAVLQKRAALKERLGLGDNWGVSDDEAGA